MESQRIHILLKKYFEAESTLEEENELINYFHSNEVDNDLKPYVALFSGIEECSAEENPELVDDLMNFILESEHKEKLKYRWKWQMVTAIAASIIVVLMVVNLSDKKSQWEDTFTDPKQAYVEASKTLEFVASKYNKGLAMLKPVKKMEAASLPLYSGMEAWNKGVKKLQNIENLKTNLKN